MTWTQAKAVERTRDRRQYGRELLLMNYPPGPVLATWVIHSKNRHLETEKDSLRWFANTGGLV